MKSKFYFLCIVIVSILASTNSFGWGFWAHKRINRVSVFLLPKDMIGFYKNPDKLKERLQQEFKQVETAVSRGA
jgi:hypothetical protein